MTTDVQETLRRVASDTTPPPVDQVAFRAAVRRERRRRTTGRVGVAVAAAAAVAAVAGPLVVLGSPDPARPGPSGGDSTVREVLPQQPVFFTRGMRLWVLDPQGRTHDLGQRAEGVLGSTFESGYVIGEQSRIVRVDADSGGEGQDGRWTFRVGRSPVAGAVASAAMSADGRWLAVADTSGTLTRLDLKSGQRTTVADAGDVLDTTATTTLTTRGEGLRSVVGRDVVELLLDEGDTPYGASAGGRRIAVPSSDGSSTAIRTVDRGTVADVRGQATLSDDGSQVVSLRTTRDDRTSVWVGPLDGQRRLPGLPSAISEVRWLDEDTVVVSDARTLWSCETTTRVCGRLPVAPDEQHRLRLGP